MRRVVVTGMGIISPFGRGVAHNWKSIVDGKSAIGQIKTFDVTDYACKIGGELPHGTESWQYNPDDIMPPREQKRVDNFVTYGMMASVDAISDSGWQPQTEEDFQRTGVLLGSGIGGILAISDCALLIKEQGPRRVSPFVIPSAITNILPGHVSIKYGYKGPNIAVVTACATGNHAIGEAAHIIARGDADVMVAGGSESPINPVPLAGFCQLRALATAFNDEPEKASRPWDKARDGFVMSEGAGALMLEEYEHAKARGAKIYAEVKGYGMSGDASHITAPSEDGSGAYQSMKNAMNRAGLNPGDIGYINAHGTSTPVGDMIEVKAVKRLFGENPSHLSMSSTKSAVGHLLGAAGAVEAIYSIMALKDGIMPPTLNLDDPEETVLDLVAKTAKERKLKAVMSNSFGFGGTNATLVFTAV
ncbi:MAG: beta-ketoacyl-ACP synthase II [Alphaproteobacteria bacterium]|nr:beta-ketoacyl-ACP synthase II [Alphaproteobacteria bacterium]